MNLRRMVSDVLEDFTAKRRSRSDELAVVMLCEFWVSRNKKKKIRFFWLKRILELFLSERVTNFVCDIIVQIKYISCNVTTIVNKK